MKQKTKVPKCSDCVHEKDKRIYRVLTIVLTIALLTAVVVAVRYKERAPHFSFAFSATDLSDGKGTIDIHGGGKFSYMAWGLGGWYWNVYIDARGSITFVTNTSEESVRWKLKPAGRLTSNGLYDQVGGSLNFTIEPTGNLPDWVSEPIDVTLIEGSESTGRVIVNIGGIETYSGTGSVVIRPLD